MDLRGVTQFQVTASALAAQSKVSPWTKGAQRTFVSGTDEVYGMTRMYELLSDDGPNQIRAFREMNDALEWLGLDEVELPTGPPEEESPD